MLSIDGGEGAVGKNGIVNTGGFKKGFLNSDSENDLVQGRNTSDDSVEMGPRIITRVSIEIDG